MILIDYVYWGWYQILDKTIYFSRSANEGIGPKEHSFFIVFLLYGLNIYSILRYAFIQYFGRSVDLTISIPIAVFIFIIGYFLYYRRGRADKVISYEMKKGQVVLSLLVTIGYTIISVYLMLKMGDYVRYELHPELRP